MPMVSPFDTIRGVYPADARRPLDAQRETWTATRPLAGLTVLDATPLFRNTLLKHEVLLAAGAEVWVGYGRAMPYDPAVVTRLGRLGLRVPDAERLRQGFDIVLDCAAAFADVPARLGYAELTRSGLGPYAALHVPVYLADGGRVKLLETALGTGDGLIRGLHHLGLGPLTGKRVAVAGCGKVGSGILFRCLREGADCTVIDRPGVRPPFGLSSVPVTDTVALNDLLTHCDMLVTATGVRDALAGRIAKEILGRPAPLFVNMGVEDEYGADVPTDRVLNGKAPLNFILEEPTDMRYIAATMALHNLAALRLRDGLPPGITLPPAADEAPLIETLEPSLRAELQDFLAAHGRGF